MKLGADSKKPEGGAVVRFRNDIDSAKAGDRRQELISSLDSDEFDQRYTVTTPTKENRYRLWPEQVTAEYRQWPRVVDLSATPPSNGLMEKRGGALIDIDSHALGARIKAYLDSDISWEVLAAQHPSGLTRDAARFKAKAARSKVKASKEYGDYSQSNLRRYAVRPFDHQWCYYIGERPVWNEPRPALWAQAWDGNSFFLSRLRSSSGAEGVPCYFVDCLSDDHLIVPDASCFPVRLRKKPNAKKSPPGAMLLFNDEADDAELTVANLSKKSRVYLHSLGIANPDANEEIAGLIWMHALAIGHAPAYLSENADGVEQNWPRVPLPANRESLQASAKLGSVVASLVNAPSLGSAQTIATAPGTGVEGVTQGKIRHELEFLGMIERSGGGALSSADLRVTAGWGHHGRKGVTAPGKGRVVERDYSEKELEALGTGVTMIGLTIDQALSRLGHSTRDIYLNDAAFWKNVPSRVWDFRVGGYQVIKKWLSYRDNDLLGRVLTLEEAEYVTEITRRIAALLLLGQALDANYANAKTNVYDWGALLTA